MKELSRGQCSQIAGGDPGMVLAGGGGGGGGGGGFGSGGGSSFGEGGFDFGEYDIFAIGVEGGQMAVVQVTGHVPIFDNTQPIAVYGPGEAPWKGGYLGTWVAPGQMSYEHIALDGALIANTGRLAGTALAAAIEGAVTGAVVGAPATPVGQVGTIAIGTLVGIGTYYLLQHDHPTGRFELAP